MEELGSVHCNICLWLFVIFYHPEGRRGTRAETAVVIIYPIFYQVFCKATSAFTPCIFKDQMKWIIVVWGIKYKRGQRFN